MNVHTYIVHALDTKCLCYIKKKKMFYLKMRQKILKYRTKHYPPSIWPPPSFFFFFFWKIDPRFFQGWIVIDPSGAQILIILRTLGFWYFIRMGRNGNNFAKMRKLAFVWHRNRKCVCLFRVFNTKLGVDSQTRPMAFFIWGGVDSDEP